MLWRYACQLPFAIAGFLRWVLVAVRLGFQIPSRHRLAILYLAVLASVWQYQCRLLLVFALGVQPLLAQALTSFGFAVFGLTLLGLGSFRLCVVLFISLIWASL